MVANFESPKSVHIGVPLEALHVSAIMRVWCGLKTVGERSWKDEDEHKAENVSSCGGEATDFLRPSKACLLVKQQHPIWLSLSNGFDTRQKQQMSIFLEYD
jgi:hypothetical protein